MLAVGVVGAISSCAAVSTQPLAPGSESARYHAAYEIAAARCDRQTPACQQRAGVHYASREACIDAKLADSAQQADLDTCADYSLRDSQLRACVAEVRAGRCGTGVANVAACRGRNLCPWDSFATVY
jgi:hypothetical protein